VPPLTRGALAVARSGTAGGAAPRFAAAAAAPLPDTAIEAAVRKPVCLWPEVSEGDGFLVAALVAGASFRRAAEGADFTAAADAAGFSAAADAAGFSAAADALGFRGAADAADCSAAADALGFTGAADATGFSAAADAPGFRGAADAAGFSAAADAAAFGFSAADEAGTTGFSLAVEEADFIVAAGPCVAPFLLITAGPAGTAAAANCMMR
jgi:hypothetical protein